eukprot:NODE_586_length_6373_cov_0.635480.p5 type:complete len:115 gc:universal NODE_586_length_6373_cov_0.635480:933-589(-)
MAVCQINLHIVSFIQGILNAAICTVVSWSSDVICIARHPIAFYVTINVGIAFFCAFFLFKKDESSTFTEHKTRSIVFKRSRSIMWRVVVLCSDCFSSGERVDCESSHTSLRTSC